MHLLSASVFAPEQQRRMPWHCIPSAQNRARPTAVSLEKHSLKPRVPLAKHRIQAPAAARTLSQASHNISDSAGALRLAWLLLLPFQAVLQMAPSLLHFLLLLVNNSFKPYYSFSIAAISVTSQGHTTSEW